MVKPPLTDYDVETYGLTDYDVDTAYHVCQKKEEEIIFWTWEKGK